LLKEQTQETNVAMTVHVEEQHCQKDVLSIYRWLSTCETRISQTISVCWNRIDHLPKTIGFSSKRDCILQVVVPLLSNDRNHDTWPHVVSGDVLRHVHKLKSNVFVVSGQVRPQNICWFLL